MLVKRKSGLKAIKLIKLIIGVFLICGLAFFVYSAPFLDISEVEIRGEGMSESEVYSFLGERVLGENILFWKPEKELQSIKLSEFSFEKDILNKKIYIDITPRKKELVWCYHSDDACFWVDREGLILEESPRLSGNLIYTIEESGAEPKKMGENVLDTDLFVNVLEIIRVLDRMKLPASRILIEDIKLREMVVYPIGGPRIVFGLNISPDFTEAAIDSIRKSGWNSVKEINLTVYGRAYASF